MAQKIVAGNWKMNLEDNQAFDLVVGLNEKLNDGDVRVILFPSSIYILPIAKMNKGAFEVGAQNFYPQESGAFTGEISVNQIKSIGGSVGLIGHSERREYFGEDNAFLKSKVDYAIENNFDFIFCCGEPLGIREAGTEQDFVKEQLEDSLFHLSADQMKGKVVAYEPIWAIGTGKTANAEQAEEMHANIRLWISEKYNVDIAQSVSILYGGSCKPSNAETLFACPNIDGGLIGGASLKADDFCAIVNAF
ncbi:MAG: triose-phosphate isomerase [Crocinitomicaceae bacterium]|nr:triose-phosphate isomerase [Crocinitomicaceae bacterium]